MNGENAADGVGITAKLADKILAAGADVITLGNHVWRQRDIIPVLERRGPVIRPANLGGPGAGLTVQEAADGTPVAVINLLGALFLSPPQSPFLVVDELVEEARRETKIVLVDFHAEATSEKVALARMLDGRVTAVLGTHTHVQTNDARVQPGGTAAITDAGMAGAAAATTMASYGPCSGNPSDPSPTCTSTFSYPASASRSRARSASSGMRSTV